MCAKGDDVTVTSGACCLLATVRPLIMLFPPTKRTVYVMHAAIVQAGLSVTVG